MEVFDEISGVHKLSAGSAQAISRECKSEFVINVHVLPNTFSSGSGTQAKKIIERFKQLQENYCKKYSYV